LKIADRREAIFRAIAEARRGDVVIIAGKGHEDYQIIGTQTIRFDDREVAREALAARQH
jgi:UDP-N-acetylmuramyl tripeptide synthase